MSPRKTLINAAKVKATSILEPVYLKLSKKFPLSVCFRKAKKTLFGGGKRPGSMSFFVDTNCHITTITPHSK